METLVAIFREDVMSMWLSIKIADFALPALFIIWMVLVLIPLRGFDLRDRVAQSVYSLFCASAGVILVIALPSQYVKIFTSFNGQVLAVAVMACLAALRWEYSNQSVTAKAAKKVMSKET